MDKKILLLSLFYISYFLYSFFFKGEKKDNSFKRTVVERSNNQEDISDLVKWSVFSKTKEESVCKTDENGFDYCLAKPIYSPEIIALDRKQVTLKGFMFPLEFSEKQKNFLMGPYPATCPFMYHVAPSEVVEVVLKNPINISYEPITVKGTLSLTYDEEIGVFYYLTE